MPNSEDEYSSDEPGADDYQDDDDYRDDGSNSEGEDGSYSDGEDASYDGNNDDYYDYENGRSSERFNDERTIKDGYWWEGREKLIAGILLCWCCLCLIIIAVVLGVVLGGKGEEVVATERPKPTERPTFAPQPLPPSMKSPAPTISSVPTVTVTLSPTVQPTSYPTTPPTISFWPTMSIPENLTLIADQDTFTQYNTSKEYEGEEYGKMDTFLVQKVPLKDESLADSVGIISFPVDEVPIHSRLEGRDNSAILRLNHVVVSPERESANYTVVRIPETRTRVEYWHGFYFTPPEDDEIGVKVGPTFQVNPTDTEIDIDVTSLFFNYTSPDNKKPKKVFFMIENRGPDQVEGGDRFYTRESETPPTLLMGFQESNGAAEESVDQGN